MINRKNPQPIASKRMSRVVKKLEHEDISRTVIWSKRRAVWVLKHLIPKTKMASSCGCIMTYGVVGIRYPVSCWSYVDIQSRCGGNNKYTQIVFDHVTSFYAVFHEEAIPADIKYNIMANMKVVNAMHCNGTVEAVMYCAAANI